MLLIKRAEEEKLAKDGGAPQSREVAVCMNNLSVQQAALGEYKEAIGTAQHALSRYQALHLNRVQGRHQAPADGASGSAATSSTELQESIDSLDTMGNISYWLLKLGEQVEACTMSKKVSSIRHKHVTLVGLGQSFNSPYAMRQCVSFCVSISADHATATSRYNQTCGPSCIKHLEKNFDVLLLRLPVSSVRIVCLHSDLQTSGSALCWALRC